MNSLPEYDTINSTSDTKATGEREQYVDDSSLEQGSGDTRERSGESHTESRNTGRVLYCLNEYEIGLKKVLDQYDDSVTEVEQEEDLTPYDDRILKVPSIF